MILSDRSVVTVFVSTVPFAAGNKLPSSLLERPDVKLIVNPLNKKLTEKELADFIPDVDILIAGTEKIDKTVFNKANRLKLISRVGIGLDGIDLRAAREAGVVVSYTPEAPAPAVAELTIGLILSLLRGIHLANTQLHRGLWERQFGVRVPNITIGIVGVGRIGSRVIRRLTSFGSPRVLVHDIRPITDVTNQLKIEAVDLDSLLEQADLVSLHLPLTSRTQNLIGERELRLMKKGSYLVNTARGGLVDEEALANALESEHLGGAAVDVFVEEPYRGRLNEIDNCILTAHMGSMSVDCRADMEIQATQEAIRYIDGEPLRGVVPDAEYQLQKK